MSNENPFPETAPKPPVALIAGPTASGKSDCAVRLAHTLAGIGRSSVIINADSAQVYSDLAVLSARPTTEDMQGVQHRLFGTWDGATACSAADWSEAATREIVAAHARNVLPILVGGTGLYIRTLLHGIAPIPPIDPDIRNWVRKLPVAEAHAQLQQADPQRAAILAPTDTTRVARALEVALSTGHPIAHWQTLCEGGIGGAITLHPLILLPDRAWLYTRCEQRFAAMLAGGAVAEVEALLARQLDPALPVMRAIGVPAIAGALANRWTWAEAEARGAQSTRNYAKRQYTWFRHQPPSDWPRLAPDEACFDDQFARLLRE